ncbi:MAG: stage II sporulation protein M [Candidatus Woesearchaeota archaeon]
MVFESILTPQIAEKKPWIVFFLGLIFSSVAVVLSNYIFPSDPSLSIVFLTTLFFIPLFYFTMIYEEEKDLDENVTETTLLKQHSKAVVFFSFLFLGMTLGFMFWSISSPVTSYFNVNPELTFRVQANTIAEINPGTGKVIASMGFFMDILVNNLFVLIFCVLFSLVYGAGAIFILTWNASVIGLALGRYFLRIAAASTGAAGIVYFRAATCSFTRYLIHGIPEIAGYFVAGLAGGIISVAIIRHDIGTDKFEKILIDATILLIIAVGIIIISALIEVFITPLIICST